MLLISNQVLCDFIWISNTNILLIQTLCLNIKTYDWFQLLRIMIALTSTIGDFTIGIKKFKFWILISIVVLQVAQLIKCTSVTLIKLLSRKFKVMNLNIYKWVFCWFYKKFSNWYILLVFLCMSKEGFVLEIFHFTLNDLRKGKCNKWPKKRKWKFRTFIT